MTPTPTDPREEKQMRPCEHRSDGLCGECLAVLNKYILEDEALTDRRITSLESANSKLAVEIAELKENLKFVMRERDEAYDRGRSHELTEGNWLEVEKQRDTALAAKDAAEKALVRIASMEPHQHSSTCMLMHRIANDAVRALTPAPTQEPPAGGVTISNETVGIIPTATTPTEASPDVSALGVEAASHPISTEKKGGDEPCATNTKTDSAPVTPSSPDRVTQTVHSTVACESPADVPPEGRGEWMPIETAPKDGTRVLIASSSGVESGYYSDRKVPKGWFADCGSKPRAPHSWQPLPPPPMLPPEGSGA